MLVKAQSWIAETFAEGSRPDLRTVKRWVEKGEVEGVTISGKLYIDTELFDLKLSGVIQQKPEAARDWKLL